MIIRNSSFLPELVDEARLADALGGSIHPPDSKIDVVETDYAAGPRFHSDIGDKQLDELLSAEDKPLLRVIFLKHGDAKVDPLAGNRQYSARAINILQRKAGLSRLLLSEMYLESASVGRFGSGCFVTENESGTGNIFQMIYYHCEPNLDHRLVQMVSDGITTTYICVNTCDRIFQRLKSALTHSPSLANRLLLTDVIIIDDVLKHFSEDLSRQWDEMAYLDADSERMGTKPLGVQQENVLLDWVCLLQGLNITDKQITFLEEAYMRFCDTFGPARHPGGAQNSSAVVVRGRRELEEASWGIYTRGAEDSLAFLKSRCRAQRDWVATSKDSTQLVFNMAAQRLSG